MESINNTSLFSGVTQNAAQAYYYDCLAAPTSHSEIINENPEAMVNQVATTVIIKTNKVSVASTQSVILKFGQAQQYISSQNNLKVRTTQRRGR